MSAVANLILGVDPGLSGAMALYNPMLDSVVDVWDMPTHELKGRRFIDIYQLADIVSKFAKEVKIAIIEELSSMPRDGVKQAFKLGQGHGIITGIVAANMVPIQPVTPSVWKAQMGLSHDKDLSRKKASYMFPKESVRFSKKKDDGRAEAVLLAVFGERFLK